MNLWEIGVGFTVFCICQCFRHWIIFLFSVSHQHFNVLHTTIAIFFGFFYRISFIVCPQYLWPTVVSFNNFIIMVKKWQKAEKTERLSGIFLLWIRIRFLSLLVSYNNVTLEFQFPIASLIYFCCGGTSSIHCKDSSIDVCRTIKNTFR